MAETPGAVREALQRLSSARYVVDASNRAQFDTDLALVTAALDAGARAVEERDALRANLINLVAAIEAKRGPLTPEKLHNASANRARLDAALADARALLAPAADRSGSL